jgi:hypothetical protein
VLDDSERAALFHRAAKGDLASLDKALAGHRSTVDWPGTYFWRELVARHPDAKVILTVRDPERRAPWTSPRPSSSPWSARWSGTAPSAAASPTVTTPSASSPKPQRGCAPRDPGGPAAGVRGVAGLAAALRLPGVPVPDGPFPHSNDSASLRARVEQRQAEGLL